MRMGEHQSTDPTTMQFIAVDFGNSRVKFGLFAATEAAFPLPLSTCGDFSLLESWLPEEPLDWLFARTGGTQYESLRDWIRKHRFGEFTGDLTFKQIPMRLDVDSPERVGIDRLLAAHAAHTWRSLHGIGQDKPMLIVDAGSAMTIDVVSADGVFQGGAILPGFAASADALARISQKLPKVDVAAISSAAYPGRNTEDAMVAGVYWGTIGAVRQCYEMVGASALVLTGGNGRVLKNSLSELVPENLLIEMPELVLTGIALCKG